MKKLVIALMAFALVITLAGCGGGGGGGSSVSQNVTLYNSKQTSEAFKTDENGSKIFASMNDMSAQFGSDISGNEKKTVLSNNTADPFYDKNGKSNRADFINSMGSRFDRYTVNEFGFKVTDFKYYPDTNELETLCSIRLNLTRKPGKDGSLAAYNDAILDQKITWKKVGDTWKIYKGFPYTKADLGF